MSIGDSHFSALPFLKAHVPLDNDPSNVMEWDLIRENH